MHTGVLAVFGQDSSEISHDINGAAIGEDGYSVFVGSTGIDPKALAAIRLSDEGELSGSWEV